MSHNGKFLDCKKWKKNLQINKKCGTADKRPKDTRLIKDKNKRSVEAGYIEETENGCSANIMNKTKLNLCTYSGSTQKHV